MKIMRNLHTTKKVRWWAKVQISFIGFYLTYDYTDIFESKFEGVTDDDIFYAESPKNQ